MPWEKDNEGTTHTSRNSNSAALFFRSADDSYSPRSVRSVFSLTSALMHSNMAHTLVRAVLFLCLFFLPSLRRSCSNPSAIIVASQRLTRATKMSLLLHISQTAYTHRWPTPKKSKLAYLLCRMGSWEAVLLTPLN